MWEEYFNVQENAEEGGEVEIAENQVVIASQKLKLENF